MHENNFVSGNVESSVARRNRTAWHNLSDERQRRRDEEDDALDDGRSWPGGRSALGETNGRGRAPLGPRRNDKAITGDHLLRRGYDS